MKSALVSVFDNIKKVGPPLYDRELAKIFELIKSNERLAELIMLVRTGERKKIELPYFTPSGQFRQRYDDAQLSHSGVVCLDYDHVGSGVPLNDAKRRIGAWPHTLACFKSPGGEGLKVFLPLAEIEAKNHLAAYQIARELADATFGLNSDAKCSNASRACFFSSDEHIYVNYAAEPLSWKPAYEKHITEVLAAVKQRPEFDVRAQGWAFLWLLTEKREAFTQGNRNNFLFQLACNANRYGVAEADTLAELTRIASECAGVTSAEIRLTVSGVYRRYAPEFAKFKLH